jgi:hypothetical protein
MNVYFSKTGRKTMAIQRPEAVAYLVSGNKQIMYIDKKTGNQVVETCKPDTGEVVDRRERTKTAYGADGPWEWTYGQPVRDRRTVEGLELSENNPIFYRHDTPTHWRWRVRQIPYPADVYRITVESEKNQIVIRTTNKKYFKRIDAPNGESLQQSEIDWHWSYGALEITHKKPPRVISQDRQDSEWRRSLPIKEESDNECPTQ